MLWVMVLILALVLYTYVVFPLAMHLVGLRESTVAAGDLPAVALLVPAHNESGQIEAKLSNLVALDYPPDKLSLWIASDGSTDETEAILKRTDSRINVLSWPECVGKTETVNRLVEASSSELIAISDADVILRPDALRKLVRRFSDSRVGAVCARRTDQAKGIYTKPQRLHNSYEGGVKRGEGVLGRVLGGDGALYALRRELFRPIDADTPDDFVSVLRVLEAGKRVAYDSEAVAMERIAAGMSGVLERRRRTVARGIRGLFAVRALLNPRRFPFISFLLISHKILRWFAGFGLLLVFVLNIFLLAIPAMRLLLTGQIMFYTFAFVGYHVQGLGPEKLLRTACYFVLSNLGAALGVIDAIRGRSWSVWSIQREGVEH